LALTSGLILCNVFFTSLYTCTCSLDGIVSEGKNLTSRLCKTDSTIWFKNSHFKALSHSCVSMHVQV